MFLEFVHYSIEAIEGLAVAIVIIVVLLATLRFLYLLTVQRPKISESYENYKRTVARAMLLALELLVAADIVYTVIVEPTLAAAAALVMADIGPVGAAGESFCLKIVALLIPQRKALKRRLASESSCVSCHARRRNSMRWTISGALLKDRLWPIARRAPSMSLQMLLANTFLQ